MTPVGVFFICQNEDKCHFVNSTRASQFQKKMLKVINQCLFQFTLIHMGIWLNLQKFHHIRIFDYFFIFRFRFCCLNFF